MSGEVTVSQLLFNPARSILNYCGNSKYCIIREIPPRFVQLALVVLNPLGGIVDTSGGLVVGAFSLITFGMHKPSNQFAISLLKNSRYLLSTPYLRLIKVFNLHASFIDNDDPLKNNGLLAYHSLSLEKKVDKLSQSTNWFIRNGVCRIAYIGVFASFLVTRTTDLAIGIILGTLAFVSLGTYGNLNNDAFQALKITGLIEDLFLCSLKFLNPWAVIARPYN